MNATDGQAPYQCSIQLRNYHTCGCAVISDEWVLTAAHCVHGHRLNYSDISLATILVGTNDLESGGTRYKAREYIKHEMQHTPSRFSHDIGLLKN